MLIGRLSAVVMRRDDVGPWFDFHMTIPRKDDESGFRRFEFGLTIDRLSFMWIAPLVKERQEVPA